MNKFICFSEPKVMAVINLNEDSFFPDSRVQKIDLFDQKVSQMLDEGADIIDLGAMSSRPGSLISNANEELTKILPYVKFFRENYPNAFLSIDTVHSLVAEACLFNGANMINDISAAQIDNALLDVIAKYNAYYCLMHMQKLPNIMQENPMYDDVCLDVLKFLKTKVAFLNQMKINKVVIDPGFGFGKSIEHNYKLLSSLEVFTILDLPILAGISRKSMIYKPLNIIPEESLSATTALNLLALQKGAKILRVHDVKEAKQAICLYNLLNN